MLKTRSLYAAIASRDLCCCFMSWKFGAETELSRPRPSDSRILTNSWISMKCLGLRIARKPLNMKVLAVMPRARLTIIIAEDRRRRLKAISAYFMYCAHLLSALRILPNSLPVNALRLQPQLGLRQAITLASFRSVGPPQADEDAERFRLKLDSVGLQVWRRVLMLGASRCLRERVSGSTRPGSQFGE